MGESGAWDARFTDSGDLVFVHNRRTDVFAYGEVRVIDRGAGTDIVHELSPYDGYCVGLDSSFVPWAMGVELLQLLPYHALQYYSAAPFAESTLIAETEIEYGNEDHAWDLNSYVTLSNGGLLVYLERIDQDGIPLYREYSYIDDTGEDPALVALAGLDADGLEFDRAFGRQADVPILQYDGQIDGVTVTRLYQGAEVIEFSYDAALAEWPFGAYIHALDDAKEVDDYCLVHICIPRDWIDSPGEEVGVNTMSVYVGQRSEAEIPFLDTWAPVAVEIGSDGTIYCYVQSPGGYEHYQLARLRLAY